jgi:hypothetical protein
MNAAQPVHSLCRSLAPYQIEVGGVLSPTEIRRGSHIITVFPTGEWQIWPSGEPDHVPPIAARLPHVLAAPALYDAHVHLHPAVGLAAYVAYGVGRIRDLGSRAGAGEEVPTARDCADPVPEIVLGGPLLDRPGKPRLSFAAPWNDPASLPAVFDAATERGASWIKLYERFPAALFETAVQHAHTRGLQVTVHPAPGDFMTAVRAGVDELQHLACLTPRGNGTRGTHAVLRRWAERGPDDGWPALPSGTAVCPTLLAGHQLIREAERGWTFPDHDPQIATFWQRLPIASRRWTEEELAAGHKATTHLSAVISRLERAGVRWVIGSDTPNPGLRPGQSMWEEMNLLTSAGLDQMTVYRLASVVCGLDNAGTHPLTFLPLSSFNSGIFPVQPPVATLLRGCLFMPSR